jgi:hypothetical protein
MQNPDPQAPRDAAPRRHDTVWNSIVTSVPSIETGRFRAISRHVRNRDIDDIRSNQVRTHKSSIHKPKPEAGLDVRQTVRGQSG